MNDIIDKSIDESKFYNATFSDNCLGFIII